MGHIEELVKQMRETPKDVKFADVCRVCDHYFGEFGEVRQKGSHIIYKTPWQGDPRINIQNDKGKAKAYQVRQVLKAIERLEAERGTGK
jgi:predicted RNA binding protein YcfA (HicA-like mRNA interferase family)